MKKSSLYFFAFIIALVGLIGWLERYSQWLLAADDFSVGHINSMSDRGEAELDSLIVDMTLEQKVGQMFMIGFWGEQPSADVLAMKREHGVGGVILLKYNISSDAQLRSLIADLQSEAQASAPGLPLFVSVDQEGGPVVRVRSEQVHEFTAQPQIADAESAYQIGFDRGSELRALGFNVNNSPVLDCVQDEDSFLYDRTFHTDCNTAGSLGAAMIHGYQDAGLLSATKHFPGHCDYGLDSHKGIPRSTLSRDEFREHIRSFELALVQQSPDFVMTGHVAFSSLDTQFPSSLSRPVVTGILRDFLHYNGIVITDDLEMQALTQNYSTAEAAVQAVRAGNDMLMYVSTPERQLEAYDAVLDAVRAGEIPIEQIDASVGRIVKAKIKVDQ